MLKLRRWQAECVESAMQHYSLHSRHFLSLAVPGAGKTVMAAELAGRMLANGSIDYVMCFAPQRSVVKSIRSTFRKILRRRFDGRKNAAGEVSTYQKMQFLKEDDWVVLDESRVLVIFDEIHHCSGDSEENANAWGQEIIRKIQNRATYTLAMTGTPWRSDKAPISLAPYCDLKGKIQCNYVYGLRRAIEDNTCRIPQLVLSNHDHIRVDIDTEQTEIYKCFADLFKAKIVSYQDLLHHDQIIRHLLSGVNEKLSELRSVDPRAGALVVASSVNHAWNILTVLKREFGEDAALVTYQQPNADKVIEDFSSSDTKWIISVGMISEGTDIPRLKVCCYLSRIRTEMYFRQVLGRVMRVTSDHPEHCWFFALAEPSIVEFANRLDEELPDDIVYFHTVQDDDTGENSEDSAVQAGADIAILKSESSDIDGLMDVKDPHEEKLPPMLPTPELGKFDVTLVGKFRRQVIDVFSYSFD